jgi:paired amphipathic helix protein Sin3a
MRFEHQPQIYRSFLEILHTYHNKQLTIQDVYTKVANLFKDNLDLLEEFKQFLPDPAINKQPRDSQTSTSVGVDQTSTAAVAAAAECTSTSTATAASKQIHGGTRRTARSTTEAPSRRTRGGRSDDRRSEGSVGTFEEHCYFFRIKNFLGPKRYNDFLKCLNLFNQEVITKHELVLLVRDLLRGEYELFNWFREFVGLEEEGPSLTFLNIRQHHHHLHNNNNNNNNNNRVVIITITSQTLHDFKLINFKFSLTDVYVLSTTADLSDDDMQFSLNDIDLSNCETCGPSYRALPPKVLYTIRS